MELLLLKGGHSFVDSIVTNASFAVVNVKPKGLGIDVVEIGGEGDEDLTVMSDRDIFDVIDFLRGSGEIFLDAFGGVVEADKERAFWDLVDDALGVCFEAFEVCHDSVFKGDEANDGPLFGGEFC